MSHRSTFQSVISLHQEELPYDLIDRNLSLPTDKSNIVTVTGVRRCGKSSLLKLAVNSLLKSGVEKERILYIGFDDEHFSEMKVQDFDEILQAYREMSSALRGYPDEYKEQVLSFDEYLRFRNVKANGFTESGAAVIRDEFKRYCVEGGFPKIVLTDGKSEK